MTKSNRNVKAIETDELNALRILVEEYKATEQKRRKEYREYMLISLFLIVSSAAIVITVLAHLFKNL